MTREGKPACRRPPLPPIEHGGPDLEELSRLGLDPDQILDFSVCTNPYGPSPRVYEALAQVRLDQYPDREALALRAALADIHAVDPRHILAGNGASELIWLTALAFVRPGDRVLVIGPTYGEYARSALLQEAVAATWNARAEDCFALVLQEVETELERSRPRLVFLGNPNNPTGSVLAPDVILNWATEHPSTLFVVDEAYQRFVPGLESLIAHRAGNLLVLRSMTKDYALAGLRLGYAVGNEEVIGALRQLQPPWSVSALAQAAGVAAIGDEEHLARSLEELARAKAGFVKSLTELALLAVRPFRALPPLPVYSGGEGRGEGGTASLAEPSRLCAGPIPLTPNPSPPSTGERGVDVQRETGEVQTAPGLVVSPSAAHFFLVDVGGGAAFKQALLTHGILVRDGASFGLPAYVRIGTRRPEENARLLGVLRQPRTGTFQAE